jgi:hypothetical protein
MALSKEARETQPARSLCVHLRMCSAQDRHALCSLKPAARPEAERHTPRRSDHPARCLRRRPGRSMEEDSHSHRRSADHPYSRVRSSDR